MSDGKAPPAGIDESDDVLVLSEEGVEDEDGKVKQD